MENTQIIGYIGALVVGLVLGLIGGGGSILTVPLLVYLLGYNPIVATAYSLFVVGSTSLIGTLQKFREGLVDVKTGLAFSFPSFIAVYLSRRYLVPNIPETLFNIGSFSLTKEMSIMVFFAIIMLIASVSMIKKGNELPEEPADEKPILHVGGAQAIFTENIPKQIQYTALGHLHRMHQVDADPCPSYYSGSPLSYSFSEANQKKYALLVDVEPSAVATVREVELTKGKKLLRKRAEGMEDALNWLAENKECLVELTLVTETFLTAVERKQLNATHSGIVAIIPEVENAEEFIDGNQKKIDLTRSMEELFRDYFKHEKGQDPNTELMSLFTEILAEEE